MYAIEGSPVYHMAFTFAHVSPNSAEYRQGSVGLIPLLQFLILHSGRRHLQHKFPEHSQTEPDRADGRPGQPVLSAVGRVDLPPVVFQVVQMLSSRFKSWALKVWGLRGFGVWIERLRVEGLGLRVEGLGSQGIRCLD